MDAMTDAAMDAMKNETILQIAGLKVAYGGIKAVKGIDLQVARGELVTLIGANGAGKTTTLKAITGTLPPCKVEGDISYLGQPLRGTQSFHGPAKAGHGAGRAGRVHPHVDSRKPVDGRVHAR